MNNSIKKYCIWLLILLTTSCHETPSILTQDKIRSINQEMTQAIKDRKLEVIEKYLFEGTQIFIDMDPNPKTGSQQINLKEYRELAKMSIQLMDDIEIQEEIISITIDKDIEQATLVVQAAVNTSIMGMSVKEASVSTTVFAVIAGEIKILSTHDEVISIDVDQQQEQETVSKPHDEFKVMLNEIKLGEVEASFSRQYLPTCLQLIDTLDQTNANQLCHSALAVIHQVSVKQRTTPMDAAKQTYDCSPEEVSNGHHLSCSQKQAEFIDTLLAHGIEMAMCLFPNSTVKLNDGWYSRTRRGSEVYREHQMMVDCQLMQFDSFLYDGFFPDSLLLDEDHRYRWDDYFEIIYEALESANNEKLETAIKQHQFGLDELKDKQFIELFVTDKTYLPWLKKFITYHKPKLNFNVDYYRQPLSYAIDLDNQAAALLLLEHGADPLIPYEFGQGNIGLAARRGMVEVVKSLISQGTDPEGTNDSENQSFGQPLIQAAGEGHQQVFEFLLEQGASLQPITPSDYPDWQPDDLMAQAVRGGNLNIIKKLIAEGVKVPQTKQTLVYLILGNDPDVMALLRLHGLALPPTDEHEHLFSALSKVIDRADLDTLKNAFTIFQSLESMGFDLSQQFNPNKSLGYQLIYNNLTTPITFATIPDDNLIKQQRTEFALAALNASIKDGFDINQTNENKTTLLMHAAKLGQHQLIQNLIDHGADINLKDETGKTALDHVQAQAQTMSEYHPEDLQMQDKYKSSIERLKGSPAVY